MAILNSGPKLIAEATQNWLAGQLIKTIYIEPGSAWEQAYIESFHDECLNRENFCSLSRSQDDPGRLTSRIQ